MKTTKNKTRISYIFAFLMVCALVLIPSSKAYAYVDIRPGSLDEDIAGLVRFVENGTMDLELAEELLNSGGFADENNKQRFRNAIEKAKNGTTTAAPEDSMVVGAPSPTPAPTPAPEKHTHTYTSQMTETPTCTEPGVITYTCECGDTYTEDCAPVAHQYTEAITQEPTCETEGIKEYKCSLCGDTYTETIEAKGHTDGASKTTTAPTCTEEGERTIYCSVCQKPLRTEEMEPTGHENKETIMTKVGFFRPGKIETRCKDCNEVLETEVLPVPIWQYVLIGVGAAVLIAAIATVILICKRKKVQL